MNNFVLMVAIKLQFHYLAAQITRILSTLRIAIADDHQLVRDGIAKVLDSLGFTVIYQCDNGKKMVEYCRKNDVDIVLMDISMPVMDGFEATTKIREISPDTGVIALSMLDDDISLIRMIRAGAKSYVLKGASSTDLKKAIVGVASDGFFSSDYVSGRLIRTFSEPGEDHLDAQHEFFNHRELDFLHYACSELTYKEIADKMCVSHRSVDGYRDRMFTKLGVKSRIGLCIFAIKNKLVKI